MLLVGPEVPILERFTLATKPAFRFRNDHVWSKKSWVGLNSSKLTAMASGFTHALDEAADNPRPVHKLCHQAQHPVPFQLSFAKTDPAKNQWFREGEILPLDGRQRNG